MKRSEKLRSAAWQKIGITLLLFAVSMAIVIWAAILLTPEGAVFKSIAIPSLALVTLAAANVSDAIRTLKLARIEAGIEYERSIRPRL